MIRKPVWNFLICIVVLASAQTLSAQTHSPATAQIEAMKKMNFLMGEWKGQGWTEFVPGDRRTASITEKVQSKMGGMVLLIEGLGTTKVPGTQEEKVVHNAMAVLWYDHQAKLYRLRSFLIDGRAVDAEAKFIGEAFQWSFKPPYGGSVRYTISLTDKGEWFEMGEMSEDGNSWRKFHEMTLQRVK
jgi:hypothetical protein